MPIKECRSNNDCSPLICHHMTRQCVECEDTYDCKGGKICRLDFCVNCYKDSQCVDGTKCDAADTQLCKKCLTNEHCKSSGFPCIRGDCQSKYHYLFIYLFCC